MAAAAKIVEPSAFYPQPTSSPGPIAVPEMSPAPGFRYIYSFRFKLKDCKLIVSLFHRHQLSEPEYEYSIEQIIRDPSYNSKVEFALKLGYTEAQLQRVLLKIGHSARENQVRRWRI